MEGRMILAFLCSSLIFGPQGQGFDNFWPLPVLDASPFEHFDVYNEGLLEDIPVVLVWHDTGLAGYGAWKMWVPDGTKGTCGPVAWNKGSA